MHSTLSAISGNTTREKVPLVVATLGTFRYTSISRWAGDDEKGLYYAALSTSLGGFTTILEASWTFIVGHQGLPQEASECACRSLGCVNEQIQYTHGENKSDIASHGHGLSTFQQFNNSAATYDPFRVNQNQGKSVQAGSRVGSQSLKLTGRCRPITYIKPRNTTTVMPLLIHLIVLLMGIATRSYVWHFDWTLNSWVHSSILAATLLILYAKKEYIHCKSSSAS